MVQSTLHDFLAFIAHAHYTHAQLSVVEYDPEINDLKTVSLHHFEDEDIRVSLTLQHTYLVSSLR